MGIINVDIIKHPMNWLTIILMVLIAGIAFHFVMEYLQNKTTTVSA